MSIVYVPHMLKDSEKEVWEIQNRFKSLWTRMRTKYEALRFPIEHYHINQNSPSPHTAASTLLELDVLGFGRVDHFPYSQI